MPELSENAKQIVKKRYFEEDETEWKQLSERVSKSISFNEIERNKWQQIFFDEINDMNFIPGGRILRNAGKLKQSLLNCACLPIEDNIDSIGKAIHYALILWKYGAGIGINFSTLREKGADLIASKGSSSGMMSFMQIFNPAAEVIETGGQRRSGLLGLCRVDHPEILDFIDAKRVDGDLSYFNLSVAVTNKFLRAVENDEEYDLIFAGRKVRSLRAREVWDRILDRMMETGDPGLINWDNLVKNNSFYYNPVSCSNLCGEIPLSPYQLCCLGSLVLPKFLSGTQTNWKKLEKTIYNSIRFLDNVLDVNYYPIKECEVATLNSRRLGLGTMGLHEYLMAKKIRYGSEKSLNEIDRLYKFIRDTAYSASISLAKEKHPFPKFIRSEFTRASFVKKLPAKIRLQIKEHGIRNCTLVSAQPTGTTSLIPETSSGIEPVFSLATERKDRVSDRYYINKYLLEYLKSEEYKLNKEKPDWLVDTSDLIPEEHFDVQVTVNKYLDNAASKTINCPKDIKKEDLSKLLLEYISELKGICVYRDGSKKGQVLNKLTFKQAEKIIKEESSVDNISEESVDCARGSCEI